MDMGRFLIEMHLRTGKPIKELARTHDVSPSWLFKLLRRHRLEGPAGLEPRSRRPKSSPSRIADVYEDEIVALRKELADAGFDAGAATIHFHLNQRLGQAPSVPTIWGAPSPGFRHPPTPQAAQELLHPVRGRSAQRALAGRHDPCAAGKRRGVQRLP
jgi:transposase-like protein